MAPAPPGTTPGRRRAKTSRADQQRATRSRACGTTGTARSARARTSARPPRATDMPPACPAARTAAGRRSQGDVAEAQLDQDRQEGAGNDRRLPRPDDVAQAQHPRQFATARRRAAPAAGPPARRAGRRSAGTCRRQGPRRVGCGRAASRRVTWRAGQPVGRRVVRRARRRSPAIAISAASASAPPSTRPASVRTWLRAARSCSGRIGAASSAHVRRRPRAGGRAGAAPLGRARSSDPRGARSHVQRVDASRSR